MPRFPSFESDALAPSSTLERVAVVGGGQMGSGIAESAARAGLAVVLREIDDEALTNARGRVERSLRRAAEAGKVGEDERRRALEGIDFTTDLDGIARSQLVVEAVPEQLELKQAVLAEVAECVDEQATIASNTSSIPIAELAAGLPAPERVVGLHFFSPVPVMRLVEVVLALETSPPTRAAAQAFVRQIGKEPIETRDRSGFVVNVLLVPYLMAAVRMLEEGFATREDIDRGMVLGCGHPMGPLALCDMLGLDTLIAVCDSLYDEFKRPEYASPPLLKRMVGAGRLGRKSGRGFYEYDADGR